MISLLILSHVYGLGSAHDLFQAQALFSKLTMILFFFCILLRIKVQDRLMIYLQAHKLLTENISWKYFFMEMGRLFNTFCFYLDLQQLYFMTMFILSSKTHYKLRYKSFIVHNFVTLYLNLHLVLGLMKVIVSL